jgi:hypothetical protein
MLEVAVVELHHRLEQEELVGLALVGKVATEAVLTKQQDQLILEVAAVVLLKELVVLEDLEL